MGSLALKAGRISWKINADMLMSKRHYCKVIKKEELLKNGSTMSKLTDDLMNIMGLVKGYQTELGDKRSYLNKYLVDKQQDLPPRTIKDSFLYAFIPLSEDLKLQDKYLSNKGFLRYGRLIEDMDMFAVLVLQKYLSNPKVPPGEPYPFSLVTIMVESILFTKYITKANRDVRLSGHICTVGASSAEIIIWLDQFYEGRWNKITETSFWMAARNANNTGKALINPLKITSKEEEELIRNAKEKRAAIIKASEQSLLKVLPTAKEQQLLHDLFKVTTKGGTLCNGTSDPPEGYKWMHQTRVHNTLLSFPQNRNLHHTVFGGFIMRQALELGFNCCCLFVDHHCKIYGVSEVLFNKPIAVGAILQMFAEVLYTKDEFIQVFVHVDSIHMKTRTESSNTLQLTFQCSTKVPKVCPCSYKEAMMHINGMRHFEKTFSFNETQKSIDYIDFHDMNKPICPQ